MADPDAIRAAFALGFLRIGTYTLPDEGGASLRAAGWRLIGERGGGEWTAPSRRQRRGIRHTMTVNRMGRRGSPYPSSGAVIIIAWIVFGLGFGAFMQGQIPEDQPRAVGADVKE